MESTKGKLMVLPDSPFMKRLGYGTAVDVFMLERSPVKGIKQSPWAIKKVGKRFKDKILPYDARLKAEAKILRTLDHPNIVSFKGSGESTDGCTVLAMEKADGSLLDLIEKRRELDQGPFFAENVMKVSFDVVKALDYLHNDRHLLHGDIKSANILVYGDFDNCKLCDFGVALPLTDQMEVVPGNCYIGTDCWTAKEVLEEKDIITDKADIFSYGLTLWEMLSLSIPNCLIENSLTWSFDGEKDPNDITNEYDSYNEEDSFGTCDSQLGKRPPLPNELDDSYKDVIEIFTVCTIEDPVSRPSARSLVNALQSMI